MKKVLKTDISANERTEVISLGQYGPVRPTSLTSLILRQESGSVINTRY